MTRAVSSNVAQESPKGKRMLRWFMHTPALSFAKSTSRKPKASTSLSIPTTAKANLQSENSKKQQDVSSNQLQLNSPRKTRHGLSAVSRSPSKPTSTEDLKDMVHELQRALDKAEVQMESLSEIDHGIESVETDTKEAPKITSATNKKNRGLQSLSECSGATDSATSENEGKEGIISPLATEASKGATFDLIEETVHEIMIDQNEVKKFTELALTTNITAKVKTEVEGEPDDKSSDMESNDSLDDENNSGRPLTPSSISGPMVWQALAFENVAGIDDANTISELETVVPPLEVTTIREPSPSSREALSMTDNPAKVLAIRLRDADERANAYRRKLETSQDLIASLFRDLERARRALQSLVSRNIALSRNVKDLQIEKEENMIRRSSLVKACGFIVPIFILWGGLQYFVSTILLVWIFIELETGWSLQDDDGDDTNTLLNEEEALLKLQEVEFPRPLAKESPIPQNIVMSTTSDL